VKCAKHTEPVGGSSPPRSKQTGIIPRLYKIMEWRRLLTERGNISNATGRVPRLCQEKSGGGRPPEMVTDFGIQ